MLNISPQAINHYANAMFRHERLNDAWIAACAGYLRTVFGERLAGRTVVDYAFGRGNWSLAFLRAGAARVIAIDDARDNVTRLSEYCIDHGIDGIEIMHGNVLDVPIDTAADIVWLYGILHHIQPAERFMEQIAAMAPGANALFYIYAYDRFSPREFIVETCREMVRYRTEDEFRRDAPYLTRAARMRARDDLAAPHIDWYTARDLTTLLAGQGLAPIARYRGFEAHLHGHVPDEFVPHQWLCQRTDDRAIEVLDPPRPYTADLDVLEDMTETVGALDLDPEERRAIGLGLFNAHFSALATDGGTNAAIVEDFLFLLYVLTSHGGHAVGAAAPYVDLAFAALEGRARDDMAAAGEPTVLARHLRERRIRI